MTTAVTEKHVKYCFQVLVNHLKKTPPPEPEFPNDSYPLFVTWNVQSGNEYRLRGCIGSFTPQKLHKGLSKYALISALEDGRFSPITLEEIPRLSCSVSLLVDFEPAKDYLDWQVGVHGIWIEFVHKNGKKDTATYLPEVMKEQDWSKEEAIHSLLRKGGFRGSIDQEYCQSFITLTRYQSQKKELSYSLD